jgi:hypothetical protein
MRSALPELRVGVAQREAADLLETDLDAGDVKQFRCKLRPYLSRAAGECRVGTKGAALALHPHQSEVAAGGAMRVVALIDDRDLEFSPEEAECDGGADQSAADDENVAADVRHAGLSLGDGCGSVQVSVARVERNHGRALLLGYRCAF